MKRILDYKLFEMESNEYYQQVPNNVYGIISIGDDYETEEWSDKNFNKLKSMLKEEYKISKKSRSKAEISGRPQGITIMDVTILNYKDEWFGVEIKMFRRVDENNWVSYYQKTYKCDQFDGLIKLLEKYKIV
jgi:ABC-type enterochelin transport system substrate-binding protein